MKLRIYLLGTKIRKMTQKLREKQQFRYPDVIRCHCDSQIP